MDKVRAFMKVAWIQRFWILSVVGVLAAVICWNMASGELQRQFTANKSQIDGKFGEMTAITGKPFHGNDVVNAKEREEAKKIANSVKELWQNLFDAQREEVLKWPDVLGNDFVDYVKNAKFDSPIKQLFRDRYQNYIKNRFEGLVKIVDAKKMALDGTASFGGGMGREGAFPGGNPGAEVMLDANGMPIEENYLVQWADQGTLRQQLEFTGVPTSRQIWVTQEDLWVYETLLRAIANTNKERGATRPDNTAISVIQSLQVGAPAALAIAQESMILMPADAMAASGEMGMPADGGMGMGRPDEMGGMGGAESLDAVLLANRYIDAEGKPIPDASAGAGVEFRRLPIRMLLSMDERYLPKILVECANAPLPIEVQRLRINAEKSGMDKEGQAFELGAAASAGGGMGMGRMEGGMGRPSSMGMGMPMGRGGMDAGMTVVPVDIPNMVTVEVQGIVYIYNPPDGTILTVPGDDAAATGSETLAAGDAGVVR